MGSSRTNLNRFWIGAVVCTIISVIVSVIVVVTLRGREDHTEVEYF